MPPDLEALQGSWMQVAFEQDGIAEPPDIYGPQGAMTTFAGDHFSVRDAGGRLLLEGRFVLDASAKTIDWIDAIGPDAGKVLAAIYTLDAARFTFIAADPGTARPTQFRTGPGQTMRSFVRCP
jgi:uncharacterized protein (TIGR03067 family)